MDAATHATMLRRFDYVFDGEGMYPAIANALRSIPPHGEAWSVDGPSGAVPITTFDQDHGGVRSVGYRIGGLAYSSDVVGLPDCATDALSGLDVWIVDALRMTPHPTHAHLAMALEWIEHYRPKRAILTNMHIDMDFATWPGRCRWASSPVTTACVSRSKFRTKRVDEAWFSGFEQRQQHAGHCRGD